MTSNSVSNFPFMGYFDFHRNAATSLNPSPVQSVTPPPSRLSPYEDPREDLSATLFSEILSPSEDEPRVKRGRTSASESNESNSENPNTGYLNFDYLHCSLVNSAKTNTVVVGSSFLPTRPTTPPFMKDKDTLNPDQILQPPDLEELEGFLSHLPPIPEEFLSHLPPIPIDPPMQKNDLDQEDFFTNQESIVIKTEEPIFPADIVNYSKSKQNWPTTSRYTLLELASNPTTRDLLTLIDTVAIEVLENLRNALNSNCRTNYSTDAVHRELVNLQALYPNAFIDPNDVFSSDDYKKMGSITFSKRSNWCKNSRLYFMTLSTRDSSRIKNNGEIADFLRYKFGKPFDIVQIASQKKVIYEKLDKKQASIY